MRLKAYPVDEKKEHGDRVLMVEPEYEEKPASFGWRITDDDSRELASENWHPDEEC